MRHVLSSKDVTWTNVQSPEPDELAEFIREVDLESSDAEYLAQNFHRPGITTRSQYVMILIQVPVFERSLRLTKGVPLFFIVRQGAIFSLHYDPIVSLDKIRHDFENSSERLEEYLSGDPMSVSLDLLGMLYDGAFTKLQRLTKHIDIAEDAVFQGNERKMVEEVSFLTRDVMDFRKVMRPQRSLFLAAPSHHLIPADVITKWGRIHGQLLKLWDVLESMFESVKELSNTNYILLQHKENELLRMLTLYSIIVIPMLILVDPLFAPRADDATLVDTAVFWGVLGVLILTLLFILMRFRGKRRI